MLVQGTWGDNDQWWLPDTPGNFAAAVKAAGHRVINGRPFNWHGALGGVTPFTDRDLLVWRGAGSHLYDRLDPPGCPASKIPDLAIVAHSHGRQVVLEALQQGLVAQLVIFVSGPIRKDVDKETSDARGNIEGRFICLHGGKRDYMQILGGLFDSKVGWRREDPRAENEAFPDATHSSLLTDPAQFERVLKYLKP